MQEVEPCRQPCTVSVMNGLFDLLDYMQWVSGMYLLQSDACTVLGIAIYQGSRRLSDQPMLIIKQVDLVYKNRVMANYGKRSEFEQKIAA